MLAALRRKLAAAAIGLRSSKHFALCRKGATAIEFALVAAPFLALLVAMFETALVFFAGRVLAEVTEEASRYILTGQAQKSNMTQSQFLTYVCTGSNTATLVSALFNCNNLMVNVQNYTNFASASTSSPTLGFNANGTVSNTWNYSPGAQGSIVVVQVMYQWPIVLGPLGFNLSNLANGNRLLVSTAVFKNEPYQ
ncbi:MAG: TadE/TadG family type IV pilus assembly protein [Xanthobacteraceae bacterium]